MSTSYEQLFIRGPIANIPSISDGKILLTTDAQRLFIDYGNNTRIEITDFVKGLTKANILSVQSPLDKFYLSSDTHEFMYYTGSAWISLNPAQDSDYGDEDDGYIPPSNNEEETT